jgi:serine protease Do
MSKLNKLPAIALILIGFVIGSVFFMQFYEGGAPQAISAPAEPLKSLPGGNPADRPLTTLRDFNQAFVDIAKAVNPTVVTVFTEKVYKVRGLPSPFFGSPFEDFFGEFFGRPYSRQPQPEEREFRQQGLGSGVIVSTDGYILTNNHVIDDADTVYVRLMDDKTVPAKIVGADPKTDIALLKVEEKNLPAIKMGDSDKLQVGEWVLAIGSPMSPNLAHTVTSGIVSAKGRSNVGLADYEDFIQTDAAINPGNSGGALINLDGELVGINTAIATRSGGFQGIGFAVPVNMAKFVMESLIKHGTVVRGYLGVYIQDIDETMAKAMKLPGTEGALVSDVTEDSPAAKAGIKQGDVILEMNGEKVKSTTQLRNTIAATMPGTEIKLKIWRDGKEKTIEVKLGKLESDKTTPETEEKLESLFGFKVKPFNSELAEKYQIEGKRSGVVVTEVKPGSNAARAGLREGDLIVAINRNKIKSLEDFNKAVEPLKKGDAVLLQIVRQNRNFFIAFDL